MALEMTGTYDLPVPREQVWSALNDPEMLKRCIPGCEELEQLSPTELRSCRGGEGRPREGEVQGQGHA